MPSFSTSSDSRSQALSVESVFERLEEKIANYEYRVQQIDFALSVERAIKTNKPGIFEAGTGTGKSLAALIPAVLSGKKVVISTATIALQEQYLYKDIPCLQSVLPFKVKSCILKGRSNYIGLRRLEEYKLQNEIDARILQWLSDTEAGDKAELDFVPNLELWNEIDSDIDDCLRNKCPNFQDCYYFSARQKAEEADIIIVNHALLLIDAISGGSVLPPYELLIIDEAHQLADIASNSFSLEVNLRGLSLVALKAAKHLACPAHIVHNLEECAEEFFQHLHQSFSLEKNRLKNKLNGLADLLQNLYFFRDWLVSINFENFLDIDKQRDKLKLKAKALTNQVNSYIRCFELVENQDKEWVFWLEKNKSNYKKTEIIAAPLEVSSLLSQYIFDKENLQSSIWMSATLATAGDDPFHYFKTQIGAPRFVVQEQILSPFDFQQQACLYLPKNMPEPNSLEYGEVSILKIEQLLRISRGRAFVLFTSYSAMLKAFESLSNKIPFPSQRQGDLPRGRLLEWFKNTKQAVLFATSSFWEGISVDGDQLSCVIIDRIPFQTPEDPIYEARCESMKAESDRNWFAELALPHAIMRLKQGVGRLIRTRSDRGLVAILDSRLTQKYYGPAILSCLPPMRIIRTLGNAQCIDDLFD